MARKKKEGARTVQVMVRRGKTLVYGEDTGVRLTYAAGDIAELSLPEARRLEALQVVEIMEEVD